MSIVDFHFFIQHFRNEHIKHLKFNNNGIDLWNETNVQYIYTQNANIFSEPKDYIWLFKNCI
jgi:hypothetical protein